MYIYIYIYITLFREYTKLRQLFQQPYEDITRYEDTLPKFNFIEISILIGNSMIIIK